MTTNKTNKSTGPISTAGKARASRNATKHGLLAKDLIITGERRQDYNQLINGLIESHQPANLAEQLLVEKMAVTLWKQRRLVKVETASINDNMNSQSELIKKGLFKKHSIDSFAFATNTERLLRYSALLDNHYYKALNTLIQLQERRKNEIIGEATITDN